LKGEYRSGSRTIAMLGQAPCEYTVLTLLIPVLT
jgi:hypothetical protein